MEFMGRYAHEGDFAMPASRSITFFPVGCGNCTLICVDDFRMVFDLHGLDGKSSYEMLKPYLPERDGIRYLDVLCISHGDQDHCKGFAEVKEEIDAGRLVIGMIWHSAFDRTNSTSDDDLPEDYLALEDELDRRRGVLHPGYGDLQVALTAWDDETRAFNGLEIPDDLSLRVLSPYRKDDETDEWDANDMCLVINLTISGLPVLFAADSSAAIWQERIFPHTLDDEDKRDWAKASVLVASHHGSYTFFGEEREYVLKATPYPANYAALEAIEPDEVIISADARFPTSYDVAGEYPPHYAAWKWYHLWFRESREVAESDHHPDQFKYTCDGHLRLELAEDGVWEWVDDWMPDDDSPSEGEKASPDGGNPGKGFVYRGGETHRGGGHYA
jgi:beta-lactamase superfamily II metal-dependent hydrolase